jgi:arsenite methyltransferase
MKDEEIKQTVRDTYARIAAGPGRSAGGAAAEAADCGCGCDAPEAMSDAASCCGPQANAEAAGCAPQAGTEAASCCAPSTGGLADAMSRVVGYSDGELGSIPEGANLGLGCGNPTALASLKEGETALDLGAGGGIDCFLASNAVGKTGHVIGVDMTAEMVSRARANAERGGYENVDFRLGEIENLPVADGTVDAIISNCVINLSPDKPRVFSEAFRTLKPGGRLMVSDIVLTGELPEEVRQSLAAYAGCVAGALPKEEYLVGLADAGFKDVEIVTETAIGSGEVEGAIASVNVRAVKPE